VPHNWGTAALFFNSNIHWNPVFRENRAGHSQFQVAESVNLSVPAAELNELISASESIVSRGRTETPNLMLIRQRNDKTVGKVSEIEKGLTEKIG